MLATAVVISAAVPMVQRLEHRQQDEGFQNNGLTEAVTWDTHTLQVNGERVFLYSGEFHYFRLPSPDLWKDVLQKLKALEFNGVSFYFDWGYHSAQKGVYDFNGIRDVQRAFDYATELGLHIVTRPGPYINAEVDCGGYPGWFIREPGATRKRDPNNDKNYLEWLDAIDKHIVRNQVTHGGRVILNQIDNEYAVNTDPRYMQMIKDKFHEDGIVVPLIHNDPGLRSGFVRGEGAPDIYGWDIYPLGFDCSQPDKWETDRNQISYREYHRRTNDEQPMAVYEFQGGAFDRWGGTGYAECRKLLNEQYAKVYYKNNFAQGVTIHNLYMTYGGISWGNLAEPGVYSSYDYAAPISESGILTAKAYENKLQGGFINTVKPFYTTEYFESQTDNDNLIVDGLADVNTDTKFYIAQHLDIGSKDLDEFTITVNTTKGALTIPRSSKLVLNGRDAKILVTNYDFGSQHLVYTTSEIFTHQDLDSRDVIVVYAYEDEDGEFAISVDNEDFKVEADSSVTSDVSDGILQLTYKHPNGTTPVHISGTEKDLLVLISGYQAATRWWAPHIDEHTRVFIHGPYLVRSASASHHSSVAFTGDIDETTDIQVVLPDKINSITWNGKKVKLEEGQNGIWTGTLQFDEPDVKYTDLTQARWKYSPASPETEPDFDDSDWLTANNLTTVSITPHDTWPVLYADEYGYHTGNIWFRGTFNGSSEITGFNITSHFGLASAWVVWFNGKYLGGWGADETGNLGYEDLNNTLLKSEGENVISVLFWTTGHGGDWNADGWHTDARGLTKAELLGVSNQTIWSIDWKIQGNLGGENIFDTVRGPYNEGGLYGERMGWHLPGFRDNDWETVSLPESTNRTGFSWYRTSFDVKIPNGYDVPMSVRIDDDTDSRYRAVIFCNGWQLGKFAHDIGPQTQFYLPRGILNVNGKNTLAIGTVAIDEGAQLGKVTLEPYGVLQSALPQVDMVDSPSYNDLRKRK
ncbi:beta galactosidase [Zychaea mexicana]|uniref:beta galactosidase n=1 Tax=Zychaea mexicana TaxID=64656 RepID=UPI0022FF193E|nr:beta galactosidase [Zychaea mexicana]KAI9494122.1 beta galactosidase [Zychaea mexicana]